MQEDEAENTILLFDQQTDANTSTALGNVRRYNDIRPALQQDQNCSARPTATKELINMHLQTSMTSKVMDVVEPHI